MINVISLILNDHCEEFNGWDFKHFIILKWDFLQFYHQKKQDRKFQIWVRHLQTLMEKLLYVGHISQVQFVLH